MTRFVLALIAILALGLSAGLSHTQLAPPSPSEGNSFQAFEAQQIVSAEFEFVPVDRQRQGTALHTSDDAPEPALVAYLALILIGSLVAVGIVRHGERSRG